MLSQRFDEASKCAKGSAFLRTKVQAREDQPLCAPSSRCCNHLNDKRGRCIITDAPASQCISPLESGLFGFRKIRSGNLVPRRGLEPPRLAAQVPETCASTNSAIWATESDVEGPPAGVNRLFEVFATAWRKAFLSAGRPIADALQSRGKQRGCGGLVGGFHVATHFRRIA